MCNCIGDKFQHVQTYDINIFYNLKYWDEFRMNALGHALRKKLYRQHDY